MAMTTTAKVARNAVPGRREASVPPTRPPAMAPAEMGSAAFQSTAPLRWCPEAPLAIVGMMTASDVPKAMRVAIVSPIPPARKMR